MEQRGVDVEAADSEWQRDKSGEHAGVRTKADLEPRPWYILPMLAGTIFIGSAAGPLMKELQRDGAAPLAVAAWRQEISAAAMLPLAIRQWFSMSPSERASVLTWTHAKVIALCAAGLAFHFNLYVWSLDKTSLTHCVFLVALSPIFLSLFAFFREGWILRSEAAGVLIAFVGSLILALGAEVERDVDFSLVGDVAALTSSCAVAVYFLCGKQLRATLPLFVYLCPVNVISFILTNLMEIWTSKNHELPGLFSWATREYALRSLVLGLGPGFLCHGTFNASLRYIKPLLLSVGLSIQPVLAAFVGWMMGLSSSPGLLTIIGGLVTVSATVLMSVFSNGGHEAKTRDTLADEDPMKRPLLK